MKSSSDIIQLSRAIDITMRPNVQQLIEHNVKCHVTFFRLIKFKISIWVCNKFYYHLAKLWWGESDISQAYGR